MRILVAILVALSLISCASHKNKTTPPTYQGWKGALVSNKYQIDELVDVSTAFAYVPSSEEDVLDVLAYNNGRLVPFIELSKLLWNDTKGLFEYRDLIHLKNRGLVAMLDEPLWRIRRACEAGNATSCAEINNGFANTQAVFTKFKQRSGLPILHIEAYLELIKQKQQFNRIFLIDSADHVGFDCYGAMENCEGHSQLEYLSWVTDAIAGTNKKVFLTVGAWSFAPTDVVINQINQYFDLYHSNPYLFSGIGVFTWGTFDGIQGAREVPRLAEVVRSRLKGDM